MIENFQYKLQQGKSRQSKGANTCTSIRREPESKKCFKPFCKTFERENMQNKKNTEHSSTLRKFFESVKNFLKKCNIKEPRPKIVKPIPVQKKLAPLPIPKTF